MKMTTDNSFPVWAPWNKTGLSTGVVTVRRLSRPSNGPFLAVVPPGTKSRMDTNNKRQRWFRSVPFYFLQDSHGGHNREAAKQTPGLSDKLLGRSGNLTPLFLDPRLLISARSGLLSPQVGNHAYTGNSTHGITNIFLQSIDNGIFRWIYPF